MRGDFRAAKENEDMSLRGVLSRESCVHSTSLVDWGGPADPPVLAGGPASQSPAPSISPETAQQEQSRL